jgi:hypothetical protein
MTNALKAPQPQLKPTYEGRHRSETKRSIGKTVLGWFHRARHSQPVAVSAENARTEVLNTPRLTTEALKTPSFELNYRHGGTRDEELRKKAINLGNREPLMTREEVAEQLGGQDFGELHAVVELPQRATTIWEEQKNKSIPLYCFKRDNQGTPEYMIMSRNQVDQVHRMYTQGYPKWGDISGSVLTMHPGDEQEIGRAVWLPDVGSDVALLDNDRALASHYESVSRSQAYINIGQDGALQIQDVGSKEGTGVTMGAVLPSALNAQTGQFPIAA